MKEQKIKRVVRYDDPIIQKDYIELLRKIYEITGDYPEVIEDEHGVYRFRINHLFRWMTEPTPGSNPDRHSISYDPARPHRVSLNDMAVGYGLGQFTLKEYMVFYMGIGYSLSGFEEVFGSILWPEEEENEETDNIKKLEASGGV